MKKATIQITPTTSISFPYSTLAEKTEILKDETGIDYVPTADELEEEVVLQELRSDYLWATGRLTDIIELPEPTVANLTQMKVMAGAIRDQARILRVLLKILRRQYNGG